MPTKGIPPRELEDADLERELRHLHDTRSETFFDGSPQALEMHTKRMLELEKEYARRRPRETRPAAGRTRAGARARAGQDPRAEPSARKTGAKSKGAKSKKATRRAAGRR